MKFKSITMENFMRYKGINTIEFSCDPEKNVTVVLGDNTVGKTTIAQAFRWGLFGAVFTERGRNPEDYQLLNNDVLAFMDADSKASVSVELVAEDEEKIYTICRKTVYTRRFPQMMSRDFQKKLAMQIADRNHPEIVTEVDGEQVQHVIDELFPPDLSHYFLFDGERWSDVTVNGVRESIKQSVHSLTGLSSYQMALWHLKDMGANSVTRKFKSKISGEGQMYDSMESDRNRLERKIQSYEEKIKTIDINIRNYEEKCQAIDQYLEENKNTEVMQTRYRQLGVVKKSQADRALTNYKLLVNEISDKGYMLCAQPLIESTVEMVKSVAGERRDIPHMRQATIDYIIKTGKCICGTPLKEGSHELECLLEQRNYLPPADIGSLLGEFEKTGARWKNRTDGLSEELQEMAQKVDDSIHDYAETCNQISELERRMDESIDFAEKRRFLTAYKSEIRNLSVEKGQCKGQIENCRKEIENIENQMRAREARSEENRKWRERLEIAEKLYTKMKQEFEQKEKKTFCELNENVQKNFMRMFNAKDKKIQLTEQYEIQMLYQTEHGYREEKNLSEGEKIARNFAFIVTVMEYSRKKKAEKAEMEGELGDTLPIVLDGPFSKLGDENIRLIAGVLPQVSEQVILFMLQKDWKYTGLDEYVGASYYIDKKAEESFASIKRVEEL